MNAGGQGRDDGESQTFIPVRVGTLTNTGRAAGSATLQDAMVGQVITHALRADGFDASEDGTGWGTPIVPIPFDTTQITSAGNYSHPQAGDPCHPLASGAHAPKEVTDALTSCDGGTHADSKPHVAYSGGVRRLLPVECERLQGFPDNWTAITYRGKPAADAPRYKSLGNSMAVPVMHWIGTRINQEPRHANA